MAIEQNCFMLIILFISLSSLSRAEFAEHMDSSASEVQHLIDAENSKCLQGNDNVACFKAKAMDFLETVMKKDDFKVGQAVNSPLPHN